MLLSLVRYRSFSMLEDRYYMRSSSFQSRLTTTVLLILVNIAVFVAQLILEQFPSVHIMGYLELSLGGLKSGYVWQLVSYGFLHANLLHLLFNCWAIYVFGQDVEQALGRKSFLILYFASMIIGGLFQALAGLWFGGYFAAPVVGASAAAFGLAAAFALLFPDRLLLLFFVIPMRAKFVLVLAGLLTLYGLLRPSGGIAHAAHLGGMLAGLGFVRFGLNWNWRWPRLRRAGSQSPRRLVKVTSSSGRWGRSKPEPETPPEDYLSKEVDPILDKISAHGIQSLTERERRVLELARERMGKR